MQDDKTEEANCSSATASGSDSTYGFIASSVSPMSLQTNKSSLTTSGVGEETSSSNASQRHSPSSSGQSLTPPLKTIQDRAKDIVENYLSREERCLSKKESSHYAQISPLRGQGLPSPFAMGLSSKPTTSHKSYFRVSI